MGYPFIGSEALATWSSHVGEDEIEVVKDIRVTTPARTASDIACRYMGREDIKVGADYEGDHHRSRRRFNKDIRRAEGVAEQGWIDVRVTVEDCEGSAVGSRSAPGAR